MEAIEANIDSRLSKRKVLCPTCKKGFFSLVNHKCRFKSYAKIVIKPVKRKNLVLPKSQQDNCHIFFKNFNFYNLPSYYYFIGNNVSC